MSQDALRDRIPAAEPVIPGHPACPGCGSGIALRLVLKALGPDTIVAMPATCGAAPAGRAPRPALSLPVVHALPGMAAATAAGMRAALDARGDRATMVLAWSGEDLGLEALSAAAERNNDLLFVHCGSGGSALPDARTVPGRDLVAILAAHRVPWAASASISHPVDLVEKVGRARRIRGLRFLHVLAPCPPGWEIGEDETVALARMAVEARVFPLVEVENGTRWRLTTPHRGDPVEPWLRRQGRFRHLTPERIRPIQSAVDARWEQLQRRVEHGT